jgi:hypothetical protein
MLEHAGELGTIARRWFEVMRICGDDVRELLHDGHPTACVGDAAFGYVNAFTAHVNVGFFRGAELPDPAGLLEGTGKFMRHVKLGPGRNVDAAVLEALIETAYADMKRRVANTTELLFSYGTLQLESVQLATFGRRLTGFKDTLPRFTLAMVAIDDAEVVATSGKSQHPIVRYTGVSADVVEGMVFEITPEELASADRYEVSAYRRVGVPLISGRRAWVYVDVRHAPPG